MKQKKIIIGSITGIVLFNIVLLTTHGDSPLHIWAKTEESVQMTLDSATRGSTATKEIESSTIPTGSSKSDEGQPSESVTSDSSSSIPTNEESSSSETVAPSETTESSTTESSEETTDSTSTSESTTESTTESSEGPKTPETSASVDNPANPATPPTTDTPSPGASLSESDKQAMQETQPPISNTEVETNYQYSVSRNQKTAEFIQTIGKDAQAIAWEADLYASVMIAQAILETGSGNSQLAQPPNYNLFGIKGSYEGASVNFATQEDNGSGSMYTIRSGFRKYPSYKESLEDYAVLLKGGISGNNRFYQATWKSHAPTYQAATAFLTGRYATDTNYDKKLNALIETYELTQFDQEAETEIIPEPVAVSIEKRVSPVAAPTKNGLPYTQIGIRDYYIDGILSNARLMLSSMKGTTRKNKELTRQPAKEILGNTQIDNKTN